MNILIVDDEAVALRYMKEILEEIVPDAHIEMANRAGTALAAFEEKAFDVVFLDISMPDRDGLELAKEFKEIRPHINIIIVSAHAQYALDVLRLYVSGYIVKPILEEDVRDALDHLRNPIKEKISGLYVQCFGNFEVFYDGKPIRFRRTKAKELFAYLIDRRGRCLHFSCLEAAGSDCSGSVNVWGKHGRIVLHREKEVVYHENRKEGEVFTSGF